MRDIKVDTFSYGNFKVSTSCPLQEHQCAMAVVQIQNTSRQHLGFDNSNTETQLDLSIVDITVDVS